jgi:hypothetical protein
MHGINANLSFYPARDAHRSNEDAQEQHERTDHQKRHSVVVFLTAIACERNISYSNGKYLAKLT